MLNISLSSIIINIILIGAGFVVSSKIRSTSFAYIIGIIIGVASLFASILFKLK